MVRHDLGLEQDAVRFLSNFGTDLLEPPLGAIDQHVAPIFRTKDHVVLHEKTMLRFALDAIHIATGYIITKKGALSSLWLKPRASRAHFGDLAENQLCNIAFEHA